MAKKESSKRRAETYVHEEEALLRPEVGTQAQFTRKKSPKRYRYDSSLSPALDWDSQNAARELGEWLIEQIQEAAKLDPPHHFTESRNYGDVVVTGLDDAVAQLVSISKPFLDWSGKAERLSFEVPTLPLFVHERLSTKAIIETLTGHERDRQMELNLFGDPQLSLAEQLDAYEHKGGWVNRTILGDSLAVMNSLLEYEGLGSEVQMIYIDPPYGVEYSSNFQPFVRRRNVKDRADDHFTREPEMVQAYRDTWELGLHSYLTYLRDRLLLARELLTPSGSVFVQISDENVHHVREIMDEVFGAENFAGQIVFLKTSSQSTRRIQSVFDVLLVYAREATSMKYRPLLQRKRPGERGAMQYKRVFSPDLSENRPMTAGELSGAKPIPEGWRVGRLGPVLSPDWQPGPRSEPYDWDGETIPVPPNTHWKYDPSPGGAMDRLRTMGRLRRSGKSLATVLLADDNPTTPLDNVWLDTGTGSFTEEQIYVVQTAAKAVQRCLLMTTDPGDLVLDPTCGSGTTAYVAEQWGRRWITIDASRVPLALARQRLLTATFPYYELQNPERGPAAGFVYRRRQNKKGDEVGGIVPHITLGSLANDEPPVEEVLVDGPEIQQKVTRVSGPFAVEATIPTPIDVETGLPDAADDATDVSYLDRMLEALRRNPVIQLGGNVTLKLANVRRPTQGLVITAEADLNGNDKLAAIVFGPENGAVAESFVFSASREANLKGYAHLLVIGFAIEPHARKLVEELETLVGIPGTYVQATPDLVMGDLLKTMRSSQLFSVAGLPDVALRKVPSGSKDGPQLYEVELIGLDTFDPTTFEAQHRSGADVPAWFLDTAWNGFPSMYRRRFSRGRARGTT